MVSYVSFVGVLFHTAALTLTTRGQSRMFEQETHRQTIFRLLILEGYSRGDIQTHMSASLAAGTVLKYCRDAMDEATRTGTPISPRRSLRKGGTRLLVNRPALSAVHRRVGLRLHEHRAIVDRLNTREFCETHRFANHTRLRVMEWGAHDFSLSELIRISVILMVPLNKLTEPNAIKIE